MSTSIGVMLPSSSIMTMAKDFERGLKAGLKESGVEDSSVEIVTEFVGQAGDKKVNEALDSFFGYHDVDIVTGIVSNLVVQSLSERFIKQKRILLNNNLGEHMVKSPNFNDHIFINSVNLFQQCWLLGNWAAKHFGERGIIGAAFYDIGYSFQIMFETGLIQASETASCEIVTCPMPEQGSMSDVNLVLDKIEESKPDFAFSLFCGDEATYFLNEFKKRGLDKQVPLLGLPFLLKPGEESLEGLKVYTTHHNFESNHPDPSYNEVFKSLGRDTGLIIGDAIIKGKPLTLPTLNDTLNTGSSKTLMSSQSPELRGEVTILESEFVKENELSSSVMFKKATDMENEEGVSQLDNMLLTGWMNPYLGI